MTDPELVRFLQGALPHAGYRWSGFRKVRGRVRKRLARRLAELGLPDLSAYQEHLQTHPEEWATFDRMCFIPISRFWRDTRVWEDLLHVVVPTLAPEGQPLRVWSAGCASGEEPYSVALLWRLGLGRTDGLDVLATDGMPHMLQRARRACYPPGNLRQLPAGWPEQAFTPVGDGRCLRRSFTEDVRFREHDLRDPPPDGPFDLVLCRNLAFTYFDETRQREAAQRFAEVLVPGGALVVGCHEQVPRSDRGVGGFEPWPAVRSVLSRSA